MGMLHKDMQPSSLKICGGNSIFCVKATMSGGKVLAETMEDGNEWMREGFKRTKTNPVDFQKNVF